MFLSYLWLFLIAINLDEQLKEIGERKDPNTLKASEQHGDKKKGFDWINLIKPPNEEKDHWVSNFA